MKHIRIESIYISSAWWIFKIIKIWFFCLLQIEGLDDHAGRLIIKLALGGQRESLNEFMVQPVPKQEYSQYGKVISKQICYLFIQF